MEKAAREFLAGLAREVPVNSSNAVVEQAPADVASGPLARMPSGVFTANASWLTIAAMAAPENRQWRQEA